MTGNFFHNAPEVTSYSIISSCHMRWVQVIGLRECFIKQSQGFSSSFGAQEHSSSLDILISASLSDVA